MSWLSQLPSHPIFSLPLSSTSPPPDSSTPLRDSTRLNELDTSRSTKLPSIFPTPNSSTPVKRSKFQQSFISSPSSTQRTPQRSLKSQYEEEKLVKEGKRNQRMVTIRGGTELIVAVGKELRICDLKQVKAGTTQSRGARDHSEESADLGDYKVLNAPEINFEIHELVANQTGKLLAVIGVHSIRVIELPRKSWINSNSSSIDVRCLEIGKFYHSLPGSPRIVQTLWHPLGQHSSSLLVLTRDSLLREYTLHESTKEPSQTISFFNESESETSQTKGFSAEDESSREATAMCFGDTFSQEEAEGEAGATDWGKMTIYGLMKNGDVKSICPFLPKRSTVSKSYLQGLTSFVSTKLDYLSSTSSSSSSQAIVPSSLSRSSDHPESSTSSPAQDRLEKRYSLQLQYLQTLLRQISNSSNAVTSSEIIEADSEQEYVDVTAPTSRPNLSTSVQGPYLFSPSTTDLELGGGLIDSFATDLTYLETKGGAEEQKLGILMIVYSDGKLEVCLEVEKPEARFKSEESSRALVVRGRTVQQEEEAEEELPMLLVYETLDLGFSQEVSSIEKELDGGKSWPSFRRDELYGGKDTVWIYSNFGVECFVLGQGIEKVWEQAVNENEKQKEERKGEESQVYWVVKTRSTGTRPDEKEEEDESIVGLEVINDVYLGYSMIAITPMLQVVGVELSLRIDPELLPSTSSPPASTPLATTATTTSSSDPRAYTSLLDTPFSLPSVFSSSKPRPSLTSTRTTSQEITVTPDSLRQLGKQVEAYQDFIRELVQGVDQVQHRLELQMKELSRQLEKLQELKRMSGDLRESTQGGGVVTRMNRVETTQVGLLERLDRVLQRLMEKHQGQDKLSTYEKKWFEELGRIEKQVKGGSGGLESKAKRVEAMWEELRPGVEEMVRKKSLTAETTSTGPGGLGKTQIRGLETKLSEEAKLLSDAKRKVERLAQSLAATSI
ncbi:uncharacterized protein JCM6883_002150 [Sporobolomyces salmoneus]|uniref:uncharacterized protein n=1 Tax=Sporobolomyces salmoneus TaxID=183962 RepID=UPI00317D69EF